MAKSTRQGTWAMPQREILAEIRLIRARRLLRLRRPTDALLRLAAAIECCQAATALLVVPFGDLVADQALAELTLITDIEHVAQWDARGRAYARALELTSVERTALIVAISRVLRFLRSEAGLDYLGRTIRGTRSGRSA